MKYLLNIHEVNVAVILTCNRKHFLNTDKSKMDDGAGKSRIADFFEISFQSRFMDVKGATKF